MYFKRTAVFESLTPGNVYFVVGDSDFIFQSDDNVGGITVTFDSDIDDDILVHEDTILLNNNTAKAPGTLELTASILYIPQEEQYHDVVMIDYTFEFASPSGKAHSIVTFPIDIFV